MIRGLVIALLGASLLVGCAGRTSTEQQYFDMGYRWADKQFQEYEPTEEGLMIGCTVFVELKGMDETLAGDQVLEGCEERMGEG